MAKSGSKDASKSKEASKELIELDKTVESARFFNRMITSVCMLYNYPVEYVTTTLPMWDVFILYEYGRDMQEMQHVRSAQNVGFELFGASDKKSKDGKAADKTPDKRLFGGEVQVQSKRRYAELEKYTMKDLIIKGK